jgi:glycerophosphoryl diester phosphodiesterase
VAPDRLEARPLVIAHRGYSAKCPENTLAAFEAAVIAGAAMMEMDVALTRDRHPVVIHDDSVDRTTDGTGGVSALTLAELRKLDAGSWFDPRFAGQRIPTLAAVLDLTRGRIQVNIEIKASAFEPQKPGDAVERQVLDAIRRFSMVDDVVVSSFEPRILERLSAAAGPLPRLALLTETPFSRADLNRCRAISAWSLNPDHSRVSRVMTETLHREGIRVLAFTVNDRKTAASLLDLGVDGFFTDDPVGLSGI